MLSLPRPNPQLVLRGATAAIGGMSAMMLAVPGKLWKFHAHGKAPWADMKEEKLAEGVPAEASKNHANLIRWMGVMGLSFVGAILRLTETDDVDKDQNQKPALQALAAFFGARAAMCGANLALGQKESGQSDESSKVHGAVSAAVAGLCLLATQDEEEESKDEKKK